MTRTRRLIHLLVALCVVSAVSIVGPAAWAHPHNVVTPGGTQAIANAQNHPAFVNGVSCDTSGTAGPAWYGLESAHHGPDAGGAGRGDGCYQTTGSVAPGADVENPVIR